MKVDVTAHHKTQLTSQCLHVFVCYMIIVNVTRSLTIFFKLFMGACR